MMPRVAQPMQAGWILQTTSGTEYLVLVHGYGQNQGPFSLTMTCSFAACAAVENDDCQGATLLTVQPTGGCEASTGTTNAYLPPPGESTV